MDVARGPERMFSKGLKKLYYILFKLLNHKITTHHFLAKNQQNFDLGSK